MNENNQRNEILSNFQLIAEAMIGEKSKKVKKDNYQEGFKMLGKQIFPNMKIPFTEFELKNVGVEFVAEWIASNWQYLSENGRNIFWSELSNSLGTKQSCRRFFIVLSHTFITFDQTVAIIPLSIVFKQSIKGTKDFPLNKELISWMRSLFFKKNKSVISKLKFQANVTEAESIALYSIACAFVPAGKNTADLSGQFAVMQWLCQSGLKLRIPDYLLSYVQDSVLAQDRNIESVRSFLPNFPQSIMFEVISSRPLDKTSASSKKLEPVQFDKKQNQLLITSGTETKRNEKPKTSHRDTSRGDVIIRKKKKKPIAPLIALDALKQYVEESERRIKGRIQEVEKLSVEKNTRKKQYFTLLDENSDLEDKLDVFREKLAQSKMHSEELQARVHSMETKLAESESKNQNIQAEKNAINVLLESERSYHQDELKRLSGKISTSSNDKEKELLNRLNHSLRKEYRQLSHIRNMDMSVQNGEKIRALLDRVFSNLQNAGMRF